jgi:hypothetical protein
MGGRGSSPHVITLCRFGLTGPSYPQLRSIRCCVARWYPISSRRAFVLLDPCLAVCGTPHTSVHTDCLRSTTVRGRLNLRGWVPRASLVWTQSVVKEHR